MIEAEKSPDLWSANQPRRDDGVVPLPNRLSRNLRMCVSVQVWRWERTDIPAQVIRQFLPLRQFYSGLQQIGWGPYLGEGKLLYSFYHFKHWSHPETPSRHIQNNIWPHIWAPCGPVMLLMHRINHHSWWILKYRFYFSNKPKINDIGLGGGQKVTATITEG